MSKMKHLLRKLHIGGGGGTGAGALTDHHHHHTHHHQHHDDNRRRIVEPSSSSSGEQQTSTSGLSSRTTTSSSAAAAAAAAAAVTTGGESAENSNSGNSNSGNANASETVTDFGLLEEEFQVQLALAMSASDPESREDPETTAQIKVAKQISLGCSPSQSLVDFQSLRYWNYDVVNCNEKVIDGFYDVYGINSNLMARGEIPSLVDLESIPVLDNLGYEVIIVNRTTDIELQKLEEKVYLMAAECQALRVGALMGFFVQKIANIVVEKMGGPVNDAEEMLRRWTAQSYELKILLNTIVLPLGSLDVGLSRQRALLFKVLADRINLPCMLVKGSYYTGTDDGALSIIRFDDGSEYIIDLMGAPGTLIPSEIPSSQLQNCGVDVRTIAPIADIFDDSCSEFGTQTGMLSVMSGIKGPTQTISSTSDPSCWRASENKETEQFGHEIVDILESPVDLSEESRGGDHEVSAVKQIKVEDASKCAYSMAKKTEFAPRLQPVLLENSAMLFPEISSGHGPLNLREEEVMEKNLLLKGEMVSNSQCQPQIYMSNNEQALTPFSELQFLNNVPYRPALESSTALLTLQKQGQWSDVSNLSNHLGNLSLSTADSGNVLVRVRNDQNIQPSDVLTKRKEVATCIQSNLCSQDDQIDPLLCGVAEWEIPWEDLQIGERIGIGSYGEVYRSDWNGTEVAVKKFMNQDISGDALVQFKCEVEIMLRLRHPNVVLFMGAVTRPPNLSILTEFLPRGSLFKLLHRSNVQLDEKRRLRMALDVAKGMNYLHTSNPIIVHRDLKTPNLLVDKNWVVKVCDFGMSRMKHHTFLSSKSTAGTAEWMAPEVLRNEPSNEKSDVYSFGVILWELVTLDVPWTAMNSMQVVGAVGFQGKRLTIPDRVDPVVAEIIMNCWDSNQHARPSFKEIITRLKCLERLVVQKTDTETKQR